MRHQLRDEACIVGLHLAPLVRHGAARGVGQRCLLGRRKRIEPCFVGDEKIGIEEQPRHQACARRVLHVLSPADGRGDDAVHRAARQRCAHLDRRENHRLRAKAPDDLLVDARSRDADLQPAQVLGRAHLPLPENQDRVRAAHHRQHLQPARLDVAAHERQDAFRHAGSRHQLVGDRERQVEKAQIRVDRLQEGAVDEGERHAAGAHRVERGLARVEHLAAGIDGDAEHALGAPRHVGCHLRELRVARMGRRDIVHQHRLGGHGSSAQQHCGDG